MYYLVDFARPKGAKDKQQRERKPNKLLADVRTIGDKALYAGGAGFAGVGLLPFRSLAVENALKHKNMNRLGAVGKGLRNMALEKLPNQVNPKTGKRVGEFLAANLPAQTGAGLLGIGAGLGYGAYKVAQNRRKNRYD